ncbi:dTDP-4-dehydrorhamnose reductase [beta proteobacterium AAP99]|nr:dTDP-4-dehydrorhamnose reductase [beta proteobacterium AAP99]
MTPRILLLGKNGQVGWELQRALAPLGELIALDRQPTHWRGEPVVGDLGQAETLAAALDHVAPSIIVNAAAYTAVDKAESEPELADRINHFAVGQLAAWARARGALLVHYSTDYVFDGSGNAAWVETDATAPLNTYGRTKLAGEEAIRASGCAHFVFRTSWVYGLHGQNFAKTMLRLAQTRDSLNVVNDQWGAPTPASLIADVTAHAIRAWLNAPSAAQAAAGAARHSTSLSGTYHLAPAGETTWQVYAQCVLDEARAAGVALRVAPEQVGGIPSSQYPTPAARPHNSRLSCTKLEQCLGLHLPQWEQEVRRTVRFIAQQMPR